MDIGQRLKSARLEAGLSQRQLCGQQITRNMLSQIENGSARPSMDTLRYLAEKLGKPLSYFLDEDAITSPNQALMLQARQAFSEEDYSGVLQILSLFQEPDDTFQWEYRLLIAMSSLSLAEASLALDRQPYARELLEQAKTAGRKTPYYTAPLERQRLLLLGQLGEFSLPDDDRELLLRAQYALRDGNPHRAAQYLGAAQQQDVPLWLHLRGQAHLAQRDYAAAAKCFRLSYGDFPRESCIYLEQCCRELEDFKGAYHYACKLRDMDR